MELVSNEKNKSINTTIIQHTPPPLIWGKDYSNNAWGLERDSLDKPSKEKISKKISKINEESYL